MRTVESDSSNLDFMRACAVLCVVGFHLVLLFQVEIPGPLSFASLGRWGVLMFFVHTSLVLALSLERQARRSAGGSLLWPFLVRRVFRIFPLSIVIVLVVVGAQIPVGHIVDDRFVAADLGAFGVLSNIFLVQNLTHGESAVVPLWSLPYEMQMYLVLPALVVLARRTRRALPFLALWAIGLAPLLRPWFFARFGVPDTVGYLPYFVPGILAFALAFDSRSKLPAILWPVALAAVTALFLQSPTDLRGAICCLLLGMLIPRFKEMTHPVVCRLAREIARYSYGIYLTHCICMWWAFQWLGGLSSFTRWTAFAISLCLVSFALFHTIEAPMIRIGRRLATSLSRKGPRETGWQKG